MKNRLLMKRTACVVLYVWNLIFFYIQKMINSYPKLMCSIPVIFTTQIYQQSLKGSNIHPRSYDIFSTKFLIIILLESVKRGDVLI